MRRITGLLFVVTGLVFLALQPAVASPAPLGMGPASDPGHGYQDLPLEALYGVSAALGRDHRAYHFSENKEGLRGRNPVQSCDIGFSDRGLAINDGAGQWGLSLSSWGYGKAQSPVAPAVPLATGNRVEYHRGALMEWYVNGPLGLQQGFTLESRPAIGKPGEELRLNLNLVGGLTAVADPDRRGVSLQRDNGQALARYAGLTVRDAEGREAAAWLEVDQGRLSIVVDDRKLIYPLVIDPFIQKAKLTASDGAAGDHLGRLVSIDGDTVVVGAYGDDSSPGSAYVFVKPDTGWSNMTQVAKLTASDGAADDRLGWSVSIDGDTVVAGAYRDDDKGDASGSAYVFVKPVAGWADMTQTAKLTASDGAADDKFGVSVSVSGDVVVAGAIGVDSGKGSAYVFVKPSGDWADMTETVKLTATDGEASDLFGISVSISGDTVLVGSYGDDGLRGSAYVFVPSGWSWSQTKLTASDGMGLDQFGFSVSISGDTVVVGAYGDDSYRGSAYVFVKPVAGWADMTETATLTASDGDNNDQFGRSVAIDGDVVAAGAPFGDYGAATSGLAYTFVKPPSGWVNMTQTGKLGASDGAVGDQFGYSVSISDDTVVVGAYQDDDNGADSGSAYAFDTQKKTGLGFLNLLLTD